MSRAGQEWLNNAKSKITAARITIGLQSDEYTLNTAAYLCVMAAEMIIKSRYIEHKRELLRVHSISELLDDLLSAEMLDSELYPLREYENILDKWASETKYPKSYRAKLENISEIIIVLTGILHTLGIAD